MAKKSSPETTSELLNAKGEIDVAKLLETNPHLLASFIHHREDEDEGGGEGEGGTQSTSMSFAIGMAALRNALGLSESYTPVKDQAAAQEMGASAQFNLGLESAQGLSMDLGRGTATNPFGTPEDTPTTNPDKKTNHKKIRKQ